MRRQNSPNKWILFLFASAFLFGCGVADGWYGSKQLPFGNNGGKGGPGDADSPTDGNPNGNPKLEHAYTIMNAKQQVDFLGVIDTSGSMNNNIADVKTGLSAFASEFSKNRSDIDLRFMATDANAEYTKGAPYGDTVLESGPDFVQKAEDLFTLIENDVNQRPGSGTETPLDSMKASLENHGSRLLRPNTDLFILLMTDVADQSNHAVSYYVDYLKNLGRNVLFYAFAETTVSACGSLENNSDSLWATRGDYIFQVQQGLGTGRFGSICNPLAPQLVAIGSDIARRGVCENLPGNPKAIVKVEINGLDVTGVVDGFHLDVATKSLCFGGLVPKDGDQVRVVYTE